MKMVVFVKMMNKVLKGLREIIRVNFFIWNRNGSFVAFIFSVLEIDAFFSFTCKVYNRQVLDCVQVLKSSDAFMVGSLAVSEIQNLLM
ncbi:MAG: hypothetical protein HUJ74_00545 [Lachnospiraceae bacterium]|mgnify:CR=1 FL=1|nr:hypothetical protein [Lachnospiraceae bacterium]